jgi:hypothetical protein
MNNPVGPTRGVLDLLAAAGDQPVVGGGIEPWKIGPFRFEVSTAQLAQQAEFLTLRTPAQRVDVQLRQIEGVALGGGATNPAIAMLITGVAISVPNLTLPEVKRVLRERVYLRIQRGNDTVFLPLAGSLGDGALGVTGQTGAALVDSSLGSPVAAVVPAPEVNLATDQVGLWYDGAAPLVLGGAPVVVVAQFFGAARESSGWAMPPGCGVSATASPGESREIAARGVGHLRIRRAL